MTKFLKTNYNRTIAYNKIDGEKLNKSTSTKLINIDTPQPSDKEEKIMEKEFLEPKNLNKDDSSNKQENNNENLNSLNSKEKNIITVDLTNDEKIVFSQLGINPLIKLGKEYLNSNNFAQLHENSKKKEKTLDIKKTTPKKVSKISQPKEEEVLEINIKANKDFKDKSTKETNYKEEVVILDKSDESELTDEINNARKKRRRSSATIK